MSPPAIQSSPEIVVACRCTLGEGPVWDGRTGTLFWVDLDGAKLWRWRPGSGEAATAAAFPERVCFAKPTPDPDVLVVGFASGIGRLSPGRLPPGDGSVPDLFRPEPDRPGNRLNDAGVGPDGSLLFGTIDDAERAPTGSFYRWSRSGLVRFGGHAVVTNGPCLDGPRGRVYASDTTRGLIHRHRLGPDGAPGEAELFATMPAADGHPDGMAVDREGGLWVCHYGGSRITRFDPDGQVNLVVPMPTPQVTMLAFGGPDLATAYVTTGSRRAAPDDPFAGHLYAFRPGIAGLPTDLCRMPP